MSAYDKVSQPELFDFHASPDGADSAYFGSFAHGPYTHHPLLQPGVGGTVQDIDFGYVTPREPQSENAFEQKPTFIGSADVKSQVMAVSDPNVPPNARKRRVSLDDEFDGLPPQKRAALAQVQLQDPNGDYYDLSGQTSPYSPFVPTPTNSTGFTPYNGQVSSPRPSGHQYSTSTASAVSLAAPSPHTPAFSPSFITVKSEQSPAPPMTPVARPSSTASPVKSIPKLVRTSTMQQSPPGMTSNLVIGQTQNFNPYAMYPLKASLELKGDLNSMKDGWSEEECDARRRLVEFKRTQESSTIHAEFRPVAPADRAPSSICISCIWWKEKNEYYVTSVDTIYLLEALVGVRFTVEEKNRIRRNLEGFRPMTVSKAKTDSEEFFKVIMGFPHPKPRNIEKDVKVFPWKILGGALKKIISKYSASYSSTASALLTPAPSTYSNSENADFYRPSSPYLDIVPSNVVIQGAPHEAGYMYGHPPVRMSVPAPMHALQQLQMPEFAPAYEVNTQCAFPVGQVAPQPTMSMSAPPMTAPLCRPPLPWEVYGNTPNYNPVVTMAPHSAPPTAYPRGVIETAEYPMPMMTYPHH